MTTKPLARFWKALDEIPEATTDRREWSLRLGDDWLIAAAYLRATGRLAKEIACPSPGGDGCPRKIVEHADGRLRAVCGNKPTECDPVDLTREEVTCLTLDRAKLSAAVGAMLNAEGEFSPGNGAAMIVGSHGVAAGIGVPIVLMIPGPMGNMSAETLTELDVNRGPVAIVVPTSRSIPQSLKATLAAAGHTILPLAEIATVKDHRLVGIRAAEALLAGLREQLLAEQAVPSTRAWFLPADARWEELAFEFTADEVVNVQFRDQTKRFEPEHLSMKDRRSGSPTEQWALLKILANCEGKFGWSNSEAKVKVKKRKQELAQKLRAAFGIEDEPVFWNRKTKVYQTRFSIRGDVLNRLSRE